MISIVIPLYNKEQSIWHTLDSVLAQTYSDYEVIVVNDGSTDRSADIVRQYIMQHPNSDSLIRVINKTNGGVCSARNRGIQEAYGSFIALLDADDLWDKDYLAEQERMITDFSNADMWGINFAEVVDGNKLIRKLSTGLPDGFRGFVEHYFEMPGRVSDLFHSSAVIIRREVFDKVGYFDERIKIAEDDDMWWRIISVCPVAFYDRYMVYYQQDTENRALLKKHALYECLPYYVDKYKAPIFRKNTAFYRYAMRWAANSLKPYLENKATRREAVSAGRRLDMSVLPIKYTLIFGLPPLFGFWFYKLTSQIKNLIR